jgi:alkaline phosphatase D
MSRQDLDDPSDRLAMPSRRAALFNARDMLLASAAAPALLAGASDVAAQEAAKLNVVHGFVTHRSILLWLQGTRAHPVRLQVMERESTSTPVQTIDAELDLRADCTATLEIGGLEEGTLHHYVVRHAKTDQVLATGSFKTQPLWQWRRDPPTLRIAAGSCAYLNEARYDRPGKPYGSDEEIFDTIAAASPELMLWLGDNIYLREVDWTSREGINRRYRYYRSHPRLQKLWQACPHIAIWDDHDFGPNDGDASFEGRGWAQEMFRRYWPLPYAPPSDGLYGRVLQGDVDIFMLDDRSYRYPNRWPAGADKVMFGAKQMQWLKAALTYSQAPFKIVAGGSQFLNRASDETREAWPKYAAEQADFMRWLAERKIPGVLFLSGDRHFSQMLRIERPGLYPLHEITTSALTAGVVTQVSQAERASTEVVPGTMLHEHNFAMITVTGPRTQRALSIEIHDTKGEKKWEWKTTAAELAAGTRT